MAVNYKYTTISLGVLSILLGVVLIIILYRNNNNKKVNKHEHDSCVGCNPKYKSGMQSYLQARNDPRIPQDPYINGYNNFCKDPSKNNWKDITGKTSGYNDFCAGVIKPVKCDLQVKCVLTNDEWSSTNHQWMDTISVPVADQMDPDRNGYNQFCNSDGTLEDWQKIWWVSNSSSSDQNLSYQQYIMVNYSKLKEQKLNCSPCDRGNDVFVGLNDLTNKKPETNGYNDFCLNSLRTKDDWYKYVYPNLPNQLPLGTNYLDPKINGYNAFCVTSGAGPN